MRVTTAGADDLNLLLKIAPALKQHVRVEKADVEVDTEDLESLEDETLESLFERWKAERACVACEFPVQLPAQARLDAPVPVTVPM